MPPLPSSSSSPSSLTSGALTSHNWLSLPELPWSKPSCVSLDLFPVPSNLSQDNAPQDPAFGAKPASKSRRKRPARPKQNIHMANNQSVTGHSVKEYVCKAIIGGQPCNFSQGMHDMMRHTYMHLPDWECPLCAAMIGRHDVLKRHVREKHLLMAEDRHIRRYTKRFLDEWSPELMHSCYKGDDCEFSYSSIVMFILLYIRLLTNSFFQTEPSHAAGFEETGQMTPAPKKRRNVNF